MRFRLPGRLALAVATGVSAHPVKVLGGTLVLIFRGLITLTEDASRQADLTTAVIVRVMTSETPARETPTMTVAVLMSEGYAGLLPPHTALRACYACGRVGTCQRASTMDSRRVTPMPSFSFA